MLSKIESSAPGKVVLSGEYAVLVGAPGVSMAVDRRARCQTWRRSSGGWSFSTHLPNWRSEHTRETLASDLPAADPARMVKFLCNPNLLPEHGEVQIDSSEFYEGGLKLGIGSSAAVMTAMGLSLNAMLGRPSDYGTLVEAHRNFQKGKGSGIDVAATWHGGVFAFRNGQVSALDLAPTVQFSFVWTGHSTDTAEMISRFESWRKGCWPTELQRLCSVAEEVAQAVSDGEELVASMGRYADAMERLDQVAGLGYWGPVHRRVKSISDDLGVPYKPSGAGGGDLGFACSTDSERLAEFERALSEIQIRIVHIGVTEHGADGREQ